MDETSDKVVVLTALPLEREAVRNLLRDLERVDHAGTVFECGRLADTHWTVCLGVTGPGNVSAAAITERAISRFRPQAVFFTGIAGAIKSDVSPGDVVVALEVYSYQGGKQDPDEFKIRSRSWESSHSLQQVAMYVHAINSWRHRLIDTDCESAKVHFKPVVAGDVVLNAPSDSPLRIFLEANYNVAVAVEMEGAGFASAAHKADGIPHLMIRGVSDQADGSKQSTDSGGAQETAARHAAAFLAEVIAQYKPASLSTESSSVAVAQDSNDELVWQTLDRPAEVSWYRDLAPVGAFRSNPALLEIHLTPVPQQGRVSAMHMRRLAEELADMGRSNGLFPITQRVEIHTTADVAIAASADSRGAQCGLAVTRSGQRSAWEELPQPGMTYVLDDEHTGNRVATLLASLREIDLVPEPPSYAPAVAIDNPMMVTVERLAEVNRQRASGMRMSDVPVRVPPEDAFAAAALDHHLSDLGQELAARLLYAFGPQGQL